MDKIKETKKLVEEYGKTLEPLPDCELSITNQPEYMCKKHGNIENSAWLFSIDGKEDFICLRCWRDLLIDKIGTVEKIKNKQQEG